MKTSTIKVDFIIEQDFQQGRPRYLVQGSSKRFTTYDKDLYQVAQLALNLNMELIVSYDDEYRIKALDLGKSNMAVEIEEEEIARRYRPEIVDVPEDRR